MSLPKIFLDRLRGKRHPAFLQRLSFFQVDFAQGKVCWIHAVSVGEVKAAAPFFCLLRQKLPDHRFVITTTTATGQEEAKRSLKEADAFLYLPFDFSFTARRFVQKIGPDLFFLVESDFWPNILSQVQKRGGKTFLLSGKMSERSSARWKKIPFFATRLFSQIDLLCVQSIEHERRFLEFVKDPHKIQVTGNLKFDMKPGKEQDHPCLDKRPYITLSSTHAPEEALLLDQLIQGPWTILLAPRHLERLGEVAELLSKKKISYIRLSELQKNLGDTKVVLIDSMGLLPMCYAKSLLGIVGGSFVPGVGGHNVLEPCLYGCPSLFGPYIFGQKEMAQKVLKAHAGAQMPVEKLMEGVKEILEVREDFSERAVSLIAALRGVSARTWEQILIKIN